MNAFALNDIVMDCRGELALNSVSLILNEGKLMALVGPKGAGKTELINILTGFMRPSSGSAFVFSYSCDEASERLHKICSPVYQTAKLYGRMTAVENAVFFAKLAGLDSREARETASEIMHKLNIWSVRDTPVFRLGHIQTCRLKIAAALVTQPKLLLIDEIENEIDDRSLCEIYALLKDLVGSTGLTVLVTSETGRHLDFADTFAVMNKGSLISSGEFTDILSSSGLKPKAKLRTLDGVLSGVDFKEDGNGGFFREIENEGEMHELIRSAITAGNKLVEAQYILPDLQEVCASLIGREGEI